LLNIHVLNPELFLKFEQLFALLADVLLLHGPFDFLLRQAIQKIAKLFQPLIVLEFSQCSQSRAERSGKQKSLAATGFDLGQENVASRHGRSDRVDPDALLPRILALQLVHFRLVRIGTDQVNIPIVGFFTDQKLLKRNGSSLK
jgi:hypothetical protein